MTLFDKILFFISVPKCVFCGEALKLGERGICKKCSVLYDNAKARNCSICSKPLYLCDCTSKYLESHYVHKLVKVFRYRSGENSPANQLIYYLKRDNRRDIVDFLAEELSNSILASVKIDSNTIITYVPRRKKAILEYGIDHSKDLAKAIAKKLSVDYAPTLISLSKKPQKKAENIEDRRENAQFKLKNRNTDLTQKTVILVDDIVTTGASMGAAAFNLKTLDAKRIIGAAISVAYKDYYIPPSSKDRFNKK